MQGIIPKPNLNLTTFQTKENNNAVSTTRNEGAVAYAHNQGAVAYVQAGNSDSIVSAEEFNRVADHIQSLISSSSKTGISNVLELIINSNIGNIISLNKEYSVIVFDKPNNETPYAASMRANNILSKQLSPEQLGKVSVMADSNQISVYY